MKISRKRTIPYSALYINVSRDETRIALSSERKIRVLSLPQFDLIETIAVKHASSFTFLQDNKSLLILTTSGRIFIWNGEHIEDLGDWPGANWEETPVYYAKDNWVVLGGSGGLWKYHPVLRQVVNIFNTRGFVRICKVLDGRIYLAVNRKSDYQKIEFAIVNLDGRIERQFYTNEPLYTRTICCPAWLNSGRIAVTTIKSSSRFCLQPSPLFYLIDQDGTIQVKRPVSLGYDAGDAFCYNECIALLHKADPIGVTFYDRRGVFLAEISTNDIASSAETNPPSSMHITEKGVLYLGTWPCLHVFDVTKFV